MADDKEPTKEASEAAAEQPPARLADKLVLSEGNSAQLQNDQKFDEGTRPSLAGGVNSISDEELLSSRKEGEALLGQIIDNQFKVLEILGRGGMSIVYKADHLVLHKVVAIKTMHSHMVSDTGALLRFKQEAQAASQLDHANVIKVYHFGVTGGDDSRPYLVMDFIEGDSLSDVLDRNGGSLSVHIVLKIFVQVCSALAHAHKKGVIHRDLKPSNIMLLERDGDPYYVKIVDFGIAKLLTQEGESAHRLTQTGEIFGSPLYMSPEQCMGRSVDKRSDVYSLGCVLYEALCGRPPHEGQNVFETFHKHTSELPDSLEIANADKTLVERLDAVVFQAMEKDPEKRYQNMSEFEQDLKDIENDLQSGMKGTGLRIGLARRQRSLRRIVKSAPRKLLIGLFLSFLVLGGAAYFWSTYNWFFQASNTVSATHTRWLEFEPATHSKLNVSAQKRQEMLDAGRVAINFGRLKHTDESVYMLNLWKERAEACAELDAPAEEIEARRMVVSILQRTGQSDAANFAPEAESLAYCLISQGGLNEALPLLEQSVFVREKALMRMPRTYIGLAYVYMKTGKYRESILQCEEALTRLQDRSSAGVADFRQSAVANAIRGDDYRALNQFKKADESYAEAQRIISDSLKVKKHKSSLIMLRELYLIRAFVRLKLHDYKGAVDLYANSIQFAEEHFGNQPEQLRAVYDAYALALFKAGDMLKAADLRRRAELLGVSSLSPASK